MNTLLPQQSAVLIGDICGSTSLYETIGDDPARKRIQKALATMVAQVEAFRGRLVNAIGDQVLCVFSEPKLAVEAACAMQAAIKSCIYEDGNTLKIRIGVHYGEVILGDDVVFGDTVNVTARIAAIASTNQITTTCAVYDALPKALKDKTIKFMQAQLKGKADPCDIFLVLWEQDDALSTFINTPSARAVEQPEELILWYGSSEVKVNKDNKVVTAGRHQTCDIVVSGVFASRQHLRCEYRLGKFFLVDQSINGTFVRLTDDSVLSLVRQELILQGSGAISLGHNSFDAPDGLIEFSISTGVD